MHRWLPLLAVCIGSFLFVVDTTVVTVALPAIGADLAAPLPALEWVANGYPLVLAVLMLAAGSVADRLGLRRAYLGGLVAFAVASLGCGLAPTVGWLIAARAAQGIGGAALAVTGFALLPAHYDGRDRGTAFGVFFAVNALGGAAGPLVGGLLTETLGWRSIFLANIPLALAAALLTAAVVAGKPLSRNVIAAKWPSRNLPFAVALLCAAVWSVAFAALVYTSVWLQDALGLGPLAAGLALLPLALATAVTSLLAGRLLHGVPPRLPLGAGLLLCGVGAALQVGLDERSGPAAILVGLVVTGVGAGLSGPAIGGAVMGTVPAERAGSVSGLLTSVRQLGQTLGVAGLGIVFAAAPGAARGVALVNAWAAVLGIVGGVLALLVLRPARTTSSRRSSRSGR